LITDQTGSRIETSQIALDFKASRVTMLFPQLSLLSFEVLEMGLTSLYHSRILSHSLSDVVGVH